MEISKEHIDLVTRFYRILKEKPFTTYRESIPEDMFVPSTNHLRSYNWTPKPNSNLQLQDIENFENEHNVKYPNIYKYWLLQANILETYVDQLYLFGNHPIAGLDPISKKITPELITLGLSPIGYHGFSAPLHILVFDHSLQIEPNQPVVKLFQTASDHTPMKLKEDIVFSSFAKLLECWNHSIEFGMVRGDDFVLREFTKIDPPGKQYWERTISENEDWDSMDP